MDTDSRDIGMEGFRRDAEQEEWRKGEIKEMRDVGNEGYRR